MTDLEIPLEQDRKLHYRFFEILPGFLSYTLLLLPFVLSIFDVTLAVFFILFYLLITFVRALGYAMRAIGGSITMRQHMKLNWPELCEDLNNRSINGLNPGIPKWHIKNIRLLDKRKYDIYPKDLYHVFIVATVNETREILEPTIQAILGSEYDMGRVILFIAYEERAGKPTKDRVDELIKVYGKKFMHAQAVGHPPNLPGEITGKGSNISYAGKQLAKYIKSKSIDPKYVIVTTLDSDNRVDKRYLPSLSYLYCVVPNPLRASFQPIAMFTNNIWDAPTMMRVIAVGNNLFYIVSTKRPHLSRNFSAHAQPLQALLETNFWSTRTVVEDGHQFWRSYFRFDGDYRVYPFSIPIYQDAVLTEGYLKTIKAQFLQLRRWTYGVSDVAYIADKGFWHKNKIPKADVLSKLLRTLENHVSWATQPIIILFAAFIPPLLKPQNLAANQLPLIVSRVQRVSLVSLILIIYISLITLPPRPARYRRHRSALMLFQWILLPVTSICFGCIAAFNSQTRLMFKKYLSKFDITEKSTITVSGRKVSSKADPSV